MSLGKLKKTLHRELTRNPAKTGTLLALIPVAGYFILPLFWKKAPGVQTVPVTANVVVAAAAPVSPAATAPGLNWQELTAWMAQDSRMKSVTASGMRNPFEAVVTAEELARAAEKKETEKLRAAPDPRPEDFGLQLTATILGQNKRLATINGRLYAEQDTVRLDQLPTTAKNQATSDGFLLKSVTKTYVLLERQGRSFKLHLPGTEETGAAEIIVENNERH